MDHRREGVSTVDKHDDTQVEVTYMVARTYTYTTTAGALKAAIGAGRGLVEPTELDEDDRDDPATYVYALLDGSPSMERDVHLIALGLEGLADLHDETVTIESVEEF